MTPPGDERRSLDRLGTEPPDRLGGKPTDKLRITVAWVCGVAAFIAAALAVWAEVTGGFRVHFLGVPLSVRGESRPALVALLLAVVSLHLFDAWRSRVAVRLLRIVPRVAPWAAAATATTIFIVCFDNASMVAGGSDASGYLSQARLFLQRNLVVSQPDVGPMPWPEPEWTFAPLGYRPDSQRRAIVPTYSPGVSMLMALATLMAGACGPYLVAPLCAALLVWSTYSIGARLSGRAVGLVAMAVIAVSPPMLFMAVQPMSDVPGAAFWTLSLLFASRMSAPRDAVFAGAAAGIAILIRPNLAPLAAIPALLTLSSSQSVRGILVRGTLFFVGCSPFLVLAGALFNHMYGSPLRSGYGSLNQYYSVSNMIPNLGVYPRWFIETHGAPAFAFVLAPFIALRYRGTARIQRFLFFSFIAGLFLCYLFFLSFSDWWYLRFLLAAFPFAFILGADAVSTIAVRFGRVARLAALLAFAAAVILIPAFDSLARHVFEHTPERRYVDAARYVDTTLPPDAIVMAMQHSGSLAYYSGKLPLRYDRIAPDWMDRTIDYFHDRGRKVYLLLDDWEIPEFAERFKGQEAAALVSSEPIAATADGRVRLFAIDDSERHGASVRMRRTHGCVPPAQPNLYSRRQE